MRWWYTHLICLVPASKSFSIKNSDKVPKDYAVKMSYLYQPIRCKNEVELFISANKNTTTIELLMIEIAILL